MQKRILLLIIFLNQLLTSLDLISIPFCTNRPLWIQSELLYWSIKKNNTSLPFVTSASLSDSIPGALDQPGTKVLLSRCNIRSRNSLGFRILAGMLIDICKNIELELSYFLLPKKRSQRSLRTTGEPGSSNLAVPIYDTTGVWGLNGIPGETVAVLPGPLFEEPGFYGNFNLCGTTKFQGAEVNAIFPLCEKDCSSLAASAGFGWMQFFESVIFSGQTHTDFNSSIPSDFFNFLDHFKKKNNFYGILFGIRAEHRYCAWKLQTILTGGLGVMHNLRRIAGSSKTEVGNLFFLTSNTAGEKLHGGIFTQPSNIGNFKRNKLGGMFETIIRGSYILEDNIEFSLGFNFILLANIARAADQVDRKINTTRTSLANASRATVGIGSGPIPFGEPGAAPAASGKRSPIPFYRTKNFWSQGLITGMLVYF